MQLILSCLLLPVLLSTAKADDVILQKKFYFPDEVSEPIDPKIKKPFCNAFTGCGKKRSDESMGTLIDLNSEPAVEDLSRQIMSEAKLWEAIQEARMELMNRKHQGERMPLRPLPLTGIRKRSQYYYQKK
ncbi:cardioactive peptide isoform X2 [Cimex lectularius]|nr:cardioactive peptide isoform X2 [Cimex lectularius]XP_014255205.1 cardioactive peptide isoform X2 [Cimex lectularius]XP_014255207.1 cardioactive peptide isoform X2 [Cimex lectularius]XP_024083154.1 cardioactive peptide isoform X2 [Cimex lectularius]